jgi:DNA polymerase III delta prime subunit
MAPADNLPLSEHLRPKRLQDLALPDHIVERLQVMLDNMAPANMLFFGPPGLGKTSAARLFLEARGEFGTLTVDGSNDTGVESMRKLVEGFASHGAWITPGLKICFIDDADFLSKPAQAALRGIIERFSPWCRFILAVNDATKIDEAVRSRLAAISFRISDADGPAVLLRIQDRVAGHLTQLGHTFDRRQIDTLIANNISDLRRMANKIEFEMLGAV